ncbi:hypothetical protein A6V39_03275 [Candidatus Mycoplasma haematobovis]|uniref:Uncharacterized protein n=1 Tax=Candidatus Mycoplasma haematobovis TaxID=432608 RepID=A0A1A9QD66_9MOLU|nr:hypothetical protein [Candidatus Mycoplasma haematobovis]OAL09906.1 hypothetical protein A6V39_03275 [Candidatus Mycoplasma haematobovis]
MNPIAKIGIGVTTVAGASGLSYGVYHNITTSTYSKSLEGTLLNTEGETHKTNWEARLVSLKVATKDTLINSLQSVKEKQNPVVAWTDLRDWCKGIIDNSNKGGKELQNIENYCTFSIKEKLTNPISEIPSGNGDNQWAVGHTKLQGIDDKKLDSVLKTTKDKIKGAEANAAVKGWCTSVFSKPFKGEKDQTFENASKVCVTG